MSHLTGHTFLAAVAHDVLAIKTHDAPGRNLRPTLGPGPAAPACASVGAEHPVVAHIPIVSKEPGWREQVRDLLAGLLALAIEAHALEKNLVAVAREDIGEYTFHVEAAAFFRARLFPGFRVQMLDAGDSELLAGGGVECGHRETAVHIGISAGHHIGSVVLD